MDRQMTPTLPDDADAWAGAWRDRLNDSTAFTDAVVEFEGTVRFTVRPDESYDGDPVHLRVVVADGECASADSVAEADYDYALSGPYEAWKSLLRDELAATDAIMDGPFDVEGDPIALMSHRDAFLEMVRAARDVDVTFTY